MSDIIYCYTGTGNSLQIAREAAGRLGCGIGMVPDLPDGPVDVSGYDRIGFVFPVHYYRAPPVIADAIGRMDLRGKTVWAAMDYGTTPGNALSSTFELLEGTGARVLFSVGCRMPENYLMMFSAPPEDECGELISAVPAFADGIAEMLERDEVVRPGSKLSGRLISSVGGRMYDPWRNTKKFRVTDACTSCGLCGEICPAGVIEMENGKPVWTEPKCLHCAGCINRCPAEAIQYGKKTEKKLRYVNPVLKG